MAPRRLGKLSVLLMLLLLLLGGAEGRDRGGRRGGPAKGSYANEYPPSPPPHRHQQQQGGVYMPQAEYSGGGDANYVPGPGSDGAGAADAQRSGYAPNAETADDVVASYTKGMASKLLVAVAAALSSSLLFHLASNVVLSRASLVVTLCLSTLCGASCFVKGDLASFSQALGVFTLLISRRTRPAKFLLRAVKQVRPLLMLSERRPFPPDANPWQYSAAPHGAGLPFSMMNAMIGIVVTGFFSGWSASKFIPFLPGWLASIVCAVIFGYQCTLRDARGDALRYVGYAVNSLLSEISTTAEDVYLREKTSLVVGKMFAFVHRLDQNYHILGRIQAVISSAAAQVASVVTRVRTDMETADKPTKGDPPPVDPSPPYRS